MALKKTPKLMSAIAHKSLSTAKLAVRVWGLADCGSRSAEALSVLRQLLPRLQALTEALPNLSKTIELAHVASQLKATRIRSPEPHSQPIEVPHGVFNFVRWLLHAPESYLREPGSEHASPLYLDVLALRWLYSAALICFSDQVLDGFSQRTQTPDRCFDEIVDSFPGALPQSLVDGADKVGYPAWIEKISEIDPDIEIVNIYSRLLAIQEVPLKRASPRPERPPPRLSERQLRSTHWHFPRPREIKRLHAFLFRELSLDPSRSRHEAGLIALSIAVCQPIQNILSWPVGNHAIERSGVNRIVFEGIHAVWLKAEHGLGNNAAKIPLNILCSWWLSFVHPGQGKHTLHDLLPYSATAWDRRAYDCLANELGCSPQRAELLTRDLLPRLLYEETSNAALVDFWRADKIKNLDRVNSIALTHYLQPSGKRTSESYYSSQKRATKASDARAPEVEVQLGSSRLTPEETKKIVKSLLAYQDAAETPIEKHNAIAYLTLFICLMVTGHRRSTAPFPFPWDFSPSEGLVFICDKLVTGSEARFSPIPPSALEYLSNYAAHLKRIAVSTLFPPAVRQYSSQVSELLGFDQTPYSTVRPHSFLPHVGVFFLLQPSGALAGQGLTTRMLDQLIEQRTGIRNTVSRLRTTLAQHLWEQGCSGRLVQAFLGHQVEMHVHGPESTWSVFDVADRVRPKIEDYLRQALEVPVEKASGKQRYVPRRFRHLVPVEESSEFKSPWLPSRHFPPLATATHDPEKGVHAPGYEGRERESAWAEQRARAVIRRELSEYLLSVLENPEGQHGGTDHEIRLTSDDRKRLEERVRAELDRDPVALKKVNAELDKLLIRYKNRTFSPIITEGLNYRLSSPGPIEISFSRSLRHALALRNVWEQSVGQPIGHPQFDAIERLAHLAISLVCFDAVLAEENLEGLVLAACSQGAESYNAQLTLRCSVTTNAYDYEFSVRPGMISTALILGCTASGTETSQIEWAEVEHRVAGILRKLMRLDAGMKWSVSRLCQIFRPYWLLRLPGAMYSVAIGEHKGPATNARSEAQLHGKELPSEFTPQKPGKTDSQGVKTAQELSLAALRKLFSKARGSLERGERRRMVQRARLKEGLLSDEAQEALHHSGHAQIVSLLLSFIGRLLDTGGPRKSQLAFTSIESYFSSVAKALIHHAWDFDFESAEPDELRLLLEKVSEEIDPKERDLVLRLFCNHLRDELSIPMFHTRWFSPREPVRTRSSLVLPDHVTSALQTLSRRADETSRNAATFIALCYSYGLRRLEAFGLSEAQFDEGDDLLHLSVSRTQIADLKSRSGRRVIPRPISRQSTSDYVKKAVLLARTSKRTTGYLFESPTRDKHILPVGPITCAATVALRAASGTATVVPHTLRHSFATILGLALFTADKTNSSLHQLEALQDFHYLNMNGLRIKEILRLPKDWPFGVDAIAMALGHADSSTFLNVYFHGSHLVIADRCKHWQPRQVKQVHLAEMLGRERTALSKLGKQLARDKAKPMFNADAVIRALVQRQSQPEAPKQSIQQASAAPAPHPNRWELFLRALEYRQGQELSLEGMKTYAIECLQLASEDVERMVEAYARVVCEAAFDDFEPRSSQLIKPISSHQKGIARGSAEREDFIARTQAWALSSKENFERLVKFIDNWLSRVSASHPTVVCRSEDELDKALEVLQALGADLAQLDLKLHGVQQPWLQNVQVRFPQATASTARASRGSSKVKVSEVSISVRQQPGSRIPDGRDLHRALAGLYVAIARCTETSPT